MAGTLLVTGGARGIGAATCRRAARAGYAVAVNYRRGEKQAEALAAEIRQLGGSAMAVRADVADETDVVGMFDAVTGRLGPVTALVNSAGIGGGPMAVADLDAAVLRDLMLTNVIGTMLCCREAARRMSRARGGQGGAIVNVSSMAATIGGRLGSSAYAASKAAVNVFTVGFAREVGQQGIRVNAVRPGMTLTDMTARLRDDPEHRAAMSRTIAMNRPAEASEIAAPILWLLSEEASFVSGCRLDASGGGFVIGTGPQEI